MKNNDESLIAEAYKKIYHESDNDYISDELRAGALEHEDKEAAQQEVNDGELKKYTYEILYATDYKYDPKTKKAISWSYKTHSSGHPDIRHQFAHSKEEALEKIYHSLPGVKDLKDKIVIRKEEPADLEEVEAEKRHNKVMSDYYAKASKTGAYSGD